MDSGDRRTTPDPQVGGRVLLDGILDEVTTINAGYARLVTFVIDAKSRGVAERLEGLTLEQVLMTRAGLPVWDARRIIASAEVLVHLPRLLARFTAGELAWATVASLARELRCLTVEQRGWADAELDGDELRRLDPEALVDAATRLADAARPDLAKRREERVYQANRVLTQMGFDGSFQMIGSFDAVTGAPILEALDAAADKVHARSDDGHDHDDRTGGDGDDPDGTRHGGEPDPVRGTGRSLAQRRADGLARLADDWLAGDSDRPARPEMLVITNVDRVAAADDTSADSTAGGTSGAGMPLFAGQVHTGLPRPVALTQQAIDLLACDAVMRQVFTDGHTVLGVAEPTDVIPENVRAALVVRDRGCRFPRCRQPARVCVAHHVAHRRNGGATNLDNLILLCRADHRRVHYHGWQVTLAADGTVTYRHGRTTLTTHPRTHTPTIEKPPPKRRRRRAPRITGRTPGGAAPRAGPSPRRQPDPVPDELPF